MNRPTPDNLTTRAEPSLRPEGSTSELASPPRVAVWADPAHIETVRTLLDLMTSEITPVSIGGPSTAGLDTIAAELDVPRRDDLRHQLQSSRADFLLLATQEPVETDDLVHAMRQGTWILSLEPPAANLQSLDRLRPDAIQRSQPTSPARVRCAPIFTEMPGYRAAIDPLEAIGPRKMIRFTHAGSADRGTLFARLIDAWRSILRFVQLPESIDASLVGPLSAAPDELPGMTGRLAAHARIAGRNTALIEVSDLAGRARRELHVLGSEGQLVVTDTGYELRQIDGVRIDHVEPAEITPPHAELIAQQWRRILTRPAPGPDINLQAQYEREAQALACCLACQLSARTGEPENPGRLLQMNR